MPIYIWSWMTWLMHGAASKAQSHHCLLWNDLRWWHASLQVKIWLYTCVSVSWLLCVSFTEFPLNPYQIFAISASFLLFITTDWEWQQHTRFVRYIPVTNLISNSNKTNPHSYGITHWGFEWYLMLNYEWKTVQRICFSSQNRMLIKWFII